MEVTVVSVLNVVVIIMKTAMMGCPGRERVLVRQVGILRVLIVTTEFLAICVTIVVRVLVLPEEHAVMGPAVTVVVVVVPVIGLVTNAAFARLVVGV